MSSRKNKNTEASFTSESNVRQIRFTDERTDQLEQIKKNPLFKKFVSPKTGKLKVTQLIDHLLEKAISNPALFFQNDMFDSKEDLLKMIDENNKAMEKVNQLLLQLFKEVFIKLDTISSLEQKIDQLAKHLDFEFQKDFQKSQQGNNIFDNRDSLSIGKKP